VQTHIILVGHALTQWNVDGRIQGHTDTPLNRTGRKMAEQLAQRLADEEIAAIYASDLQRAVKTAEPVAQLKGLAVTTDVRLREGRSVNQETSQRYPTLSFHQTFETEADVRHRMLAVLTETAEAHSGKRVLVVSHMGAIGIFIAHLLNHFPDHGAVSYQGKRTALNQLRYANGCWTCLSVDDDRHLRAMDGASIHANHG